MGDRGDEAFLVAPLAKAARVDHRQVVCDDAGRATALRLGLPAVAWPDLLLHGPAGSP